MGALAAAGIGGDILGGVMGMVGQNQQNQANIGLQNAAENWETSMSDTAHQREVSDLKAAGLNPILSAGGLSGASTPSAPPVSVGNVAGQAAAPIEAIGSTALQMMQGIKQMAVSDSQAKLNQANATVAQRNAGIKSTESDVMSDTDDLYKAVKAKFLNWYNSSGMNQTNASQATPADDLGNTKVINIPSAAPMSFTGGN